MSKQNITLGIAILALILGGFSLVGGNNQSANLGAVGTRFPNGIVAGSGSIAASGDFVADTDTLTVKAANNNVGIGTSSPSTMGELVIDSSATTTLYIGSNSATKGGCIQIDNNLGSTTKAYINNNAWVIAAGTCR